LHHAAAPSSCGRQRSLRNGWRCRWQAPSAPWSWCRWRSMPCLRCQRGERLHRVRRTLPQHPHAGYYVVGDLREILAHGGPSFCWGRESREMRRVDLLGFRRGGANDHRGAILRIDLHQLGNWQDRTWPWGHHAPNSHPHVACGSRTVFKPHPYLVRSSPDSRHATNGLARQKSAISRHRHVSHWEVEIVSERRTPNGVAFVIDLPTGSSG
jgi:hypothetical protein